MEADRKIVWVTITEAPVEMADMVIMSELSSYGTITRGSMRRGYVRGHKSSGLENGTRYV